MDWSNEREALTRTGTALAQGGDHPDRWDPWGTGLDSFRFGVSSRDQSHVRAASSFAERAKHEGECVKLEAPSCLSGVLRFGTLAEVTRPLRV